MGKSSDTLTKAEIAGAINCKVGISQTTSLEIVQAILDAMGSAMEGGQNVKIAGFGTFLLRDKRARVGRNPKTGDEAPISARRVLTFRPSQGLKDQIAKGI
ncbi:integration host factor subunit alpha [Novosphingobium sp. P6W]|uniref:integration host factor subunit alpha n=1 Tax=Novosphingobium sp. P6W TaxID=1609758 RepID=UPI0005C2CB72|nr:integration host factor subunit alpha [Novosphingobium sp. P6W]AXB80432.1 integration host factor subunit alpha [Novosphingobium sp. P6W]KIS31362.1 integration host factor subunit alpha [Novosphingobium sp. P6W]